LAADFPTTLAAGRPSAIEGELSDAKVSVRRVPLVRELRPAVDAQAVRAVRALLVETRATILHTHMAKAGTVGRVAAASLRVRPRSVHTFHGHVLEGYFSTATQRAFLEVERRLARRTDALVAVSPEILDSLLELGIGTPDQFHMIPLGFDLGPFLEIERPSGVLRSHIGLGPEVPLVGVLGRLVAIKDNQSLLAAMTRLPSAHLAVVGDGELRGGLEAAARTMGIAERVHFTGWWPDVASALSDVDVVALTSRNEGTPVSLIEAAAAGRPVVATRVGGVPSVVLDGVTGHLVEPGSVEGIADRICGLLDDAGSRRHMGLAGREHVRERFGQDRLLADIRGLYAHLGSLPSRG